MATSFPRTIIEAVSDLRGGLRGGCWCIWARARLSAAGSQCQGTVGPAQRYVSSQVGEGDVTLGDTCGSRADADRRVPGDGQGPELPRSSQAIPISLRSPSNSAAMSAIAANPGEFRACAQNPANFHQLVQQASALSAASSNVSSASALSVMAQNSAAFSKLSQFPGAFAAMSGHASAFSALSGHQAAFAAMAKQGSAFSKYANNFAAFKADAANAAQQCRRCRATASAFANARVRTRRRCRRWARDTSAFSALATNGGQFSAPAQQCVPRSTTSRSRPG